MILQLRRWLSRRSLVLVGDSGYAVLDLLHLCQSLSEPITLIFRLRVKMLPRHHPDRIRIAFDDHRLVANAGLILPATLARRLGLPELVHNHLDLGRAPSQANTGDKMMTLVASALAGGDCIDDADAQRTGRTVRVLGFTAKAPSTLGAFLRGLRWGHVRQLDRVSRELLARAWAAGAGPGDGPFTIDLDSTICETYGLTSTVMGPRPLVRGAGPKVGHRTWAPVGSPVALPGALPHATPAADTVSRSIPRQRPRTLGRSAAWNR